MNSIYRKGTQNLTYYDPILFILLILSKNPVQVLLGRVQAV